MSASVSLGLQFREQLPWVVAEELDQFIAAVQANFNATLPGLTPAGGVDVSLLVGLQFREQLPPVVAAELDQLVAAIQQAFNAQQLTSQLTTTYGVVTLGVGDLSKSSTLTAAVNRSNSIIECLGSTTGGDAVSNQASVELSTDGRTVTATRAGLSAGYILNVSYCITTFTAGILSSPPQDFSVSFGAAEFNKTAILSPPLTMAQTRLAYRGTQVPNGGEPYDTWRWTLTDTGTVTVIRGTDGVATLKVYGTAYQVA